MDYYISKESIRDFIKLPKTFDWDWVDQEAGFDKVFRIVPEDKYQELSQSTETADVEIVRLLTKAAVHYAYVLDIPRQKVMISNYGIDQAKQERTSAAPWWDVRDLGFKYLKTADQSLSKAITKISANETLSDELDFFANNNTFIPTPGAFNTIYGINDSTDVYLQLAPLMNRAMEAMILSKLKTCTVEIIETNETVRKLIRSALAFYALHYAADLPLFTFLNNAVVIQFEELPWQKSLILDQKARYNAGNTFRKMADETMEQVLKYIRDNPTEFPCYTADEAQDFAPVKKKSGLYLI